MNSTASNDDTPNNVHNEETESPNPSTLATPRRVWIAILLGLFFSVTAQVYCGRLRRAICLEFVGWSFTIIASILFFYVPWKPMVAIVLLVILLWRLLYIPVDAACIAYRSKPAVRKSYQGIWAYFLIIIGLLSFEFGAGIVFRGYVARGFVVPTGSMNLTILPGDRILVDLMCYRFASPKRGDVAAFYTKGPNSDIYVHRIIGLPGDVVEIRDEKLYLNGTLQNEPYVHLRVEKETDYVIEKLYNYGPETVPEGHFFQMGDNRRRSADSRLTGCIPLQDIIGKVQVVYWSRGPEEPDAETEMPRMPHRPPENKPNIIRWERIGQRIK
jgi:signal peptidase I